MAKLKKPTCTRLVVEALRGRDDFMTAPMLARETGCTLNQTKVTLHDLRRARVVDVVVQPDGGAWWYARPAEEDTRVRSLDEIQAEIHRRRRPKFPKLK